MIKAISIQNHIFWVNNIDRVYRIDDKVWHYIHVYFLNGEYLKFDYRKQADRDKEYYRILNAMNGVMWGAIDD